MGTLFTIILMKRGLEGLIDLIVHVTHVICIQGSFVNHLVNYSRLDTIINNPPTWATSDY